jgi:hypothetical protein
MPAGFHEVLLNMRDVHAYQEEGEKDTADEQPLCDRERDGNATSRVLAGRENFVRPVLRC